MNVAMLPLQILGLRQDLRPVIHHLRVLGCVQIEDLAESPEISARPLLLDRETLRLHEEVGFLVARIEGLIQAFGGEGCARASYLQADDLAAARQGVEELLPLVQELSGRRDKLQAELSSLPRYEATMRKLLPIIPPSAHQPGNVTVGVLVSRSHISVLDSIGNRVLELTHGRAGDQLAVILRAYDIRNLKAILRGLSAHASPDEILFTVVPAGELTRPILAELSRAADPRAAIDLLATLALPLAYPLLRLRGDRPGAETPEMELQLDQWYYEDAFDGLQRDQDTGQILFSALQLDADMTNLQTVMRSAYAPEEREVLRKWQGTGDITRILVGPGRLSFAWLARAASQESGCGGGGAGRVSL